MIKEFIDEIEGEKDEELKGLIFKGLEEVLKEDYEEGGGRYGEWVGGIMDGIGLEEVEDEAVLGRGLGILLSLSRFTETLKIYTSKLPTLPSGNIATGSVIRGLGRHPGMWNLVNKVYDNWGERRDVVVVSSYFKAAGEEVKRGGGEGIVEQCLRRLEEAGEMVNTVVYNSMIRVAGESSDPSTAFSTYSQMLSSGFTPNIITFGSLMSSCTTLSSIKTVFTYMSEHDIEPNSYVIGASVGCCVRLGESGEARRIVEDVVRKGGEVNVATFNAVIGSCVDAHDTSSALTVSGLMFLTSTSPNTSTYTKLLYLLCTERKTDRAVEILNMCYEKGVEVEVGVYVRVVQECERGREYRKALEVYELMRKSGVNFYESKLLDVGFKRVLKIVNEGISLPRTSILDIF
ncbi:hypothetical protein TrST_g9310 [Triparma strigata]|uniref:Pentatricopeptide repeat-containing protein n=1 Tax=Triparma strigata TaxID=1606541 RepID=A0A9W7C321_9STRA|nr:hypothetical protein TrST_g9310 [Triparma strigata]